MNIKTESKLIQQKPIYYGKTLSNRTVSNFVTQYHTSL
jgi:hypothetical protein